MSMDGSSVEKLSIGPRSQKRWTRLSRHSNSKSKVMSLKQRKRQKSLRQEVRTERDPRMKKPKLKIFISLRPSILPFATLISCQ